MVVSPRVIHGADIMVSGERPLGQVLADLRSAGFRGNIPSLASAYREACSIAEAIRADRFRFTSNWEDLLRFELDAQPVPAGLQTVRQAIRDGLGQTELLKPLEEFLSTWAGTFFDTYRIVAEVASEARPCIEGPMINYWARLLYPNVGAIGSRNIWMAVASEAARQSGIVGKTPTMIPDYLVSIVDGGNPKLSFHTCGTAPGVIHFKPADLPGYAVIDPGGYSGWSTLARLQLIDLDLPSPIEAEAFYQQHWREVVLGNISKYTQAAPGIPSLPDRYVFVPLQVATDRTQQLARIPMMTMLDMVIARFIDTDVKVVVKRHPKCRNTEVAARIDQLTANGTILLRDDSIHTLISGAEAVFTVNSGVGSEAMVHLKPIYLFGEADYNLAAHRISNEDDLNRLTAEFSPALPETQMKQFLCYYRTRYLVDVEDGSRLSSAIAERVFKEHVPSPLYAVSA